MSRNVLADAARESLKIMWWQLGWAAAVAVFCAALFGARAGWSALAGAGIGLIWTVYMAFAQFRHSLNHGVRLSAVGFFAGWMIKVALTVSLLVIAFRSAAMTPLAVLAGLFGAMVSYWSWLAFGLSRRSS